MQLDEARVLTPGSPPTALRIAIIGAGMGGLTAALALAKKGFQDIRVYESASNLGFVGAGIQLAPNLVRILDRLGCWDSIESGSTVVLETSIREGSSNTELTHVHINGVREKYGYPHCVGHRASLAESLYKACENENAIRIIFGQTLCGFDSFDPKPIFRLKPSKGEGNAYPVEADVLLSADGVKSITRSELLAQTGHAVVAQDTGQAAYRVMLPRAAMASDPEMMALLDSGQVTRWIGEKRHWICYPIASRSIYNMSSIQPDVNFAAVPSSTYTTKGSKQAMLNVFSDFCPLIQRMLQLVPEGEVCEWKLRVHEPLPSWVHGSVALLGDACHPTLPHLGQGAAMAIEDAAVLGEVLSRAPDASEATLTKCLRVYEELRRDRTTTLVELAALSGKALHLSEGKAKKERDRQFAESREGRGNVPDKWASPEVQEMIYGHDCMQHAADRFHEIYCKID